MRKNVPAGTKRKRKLKEKEKKTQTHRESYVLTYEPAHSCFPPLFFLFLSFPFLSILRNELCKKVLGILKIDTDSRLPPALNHAETHVGGSVASMLREYASKRQFKIVAALAPHVAAMSRTTRGARPVCNQEITACPPPPDKSDRGH